MFETILVPLDGSELARQALPYAAALARAYGSRVDLLGVCESALKEEGKACQLTISADEEKLKKQFAGTGASAKTVVLSGGPARQIVEYADKNNFSLIIMTSHGRSGLGPWSLGSTVQRLLQLRARTPVLIVRASEGSECATNVFQSIFMPLDGSTRGETALPYVIELAGKFDIRVTLFQAIEMERHVHAGFGGYMDVRYADVNPEVQKKKAADYLEKVAAQFKGTRAQVKTEIRQGDAARMIIDLVRDQSQCLIAMASHGHSGVDAWMYGSVAYKVAEASDRSLFLVRAPTRE